MVQVSDVHEIRAHAIEHLGEAPIDAGLPVAVPIARVVHDVQRDARVVGVGLGAEPKVGGERILLAGKDVHPVARGKRVAQRLRVDLGSGVVAHGVAVDDLEDLHGQDAFCTIDKTTMSVEMFLQEDPWNNSRTSRRPNTIR